MIPDTTFPPPVGLSVPGQPSPTPSIPSFFAIMREALRLYRRNFWAYLSVTLLAALSTLLPIAYVVWLVVVERSSFASDATPAVVLALMVLAPGVAVPVITAAALVDTSGGRATAPESFILVLRRLPAFLLVWILVSPVIAASLLFIIPGVLVYVGLSMLEIVFLAEDLGPFASLRRGWRLAWKGGVATRAMSLALVATLASATIFFVFGAVIEVTGYAIMTPDAPGNSMMPAPEALTAAVLLAFSLLIVPPALVLPAFILAKVVLYRHAALLYPPRQHHAPRAADAPEPGGDA